MTNIIVGQSISGSLTSTSPKIVDPTSPFNGQFYDDFDLSVSVIDFNNLPFLQAASKEFGDIGSVKIGETRSTNIFVQPPAGSAPGASTVIQLINTITNSVDAQSISTSSEALKFVKNAEIVGTNYTIRVINAVPGEYKISLAGAIQAVQITNGTPTVAAGLPPAVMIDPAIGSQINPNPNSPDKPVTALISNDETATDPVVDQPNPTPITGGRFNSSNAGGFNSSSAGGVPVSTPDRPDRPVTALISNDETATAPVVDQPNPTPITGGRFNSSNAGGFNSSSAGGVPVLTPDRPDRPVTALISNDETATAPVVDQPNPTPITGGRFNSSNAGGFNSSSAGGVPVSTPDRPDRPVTALISNDETATAPVVDQPNPTPITAGSETSSPNAGGQPTGIDSGVPIVVAIDPPTGNQPIPTPSTDGIPLVFPPEQVPSVIPDNQAIPPQARNFVLPESMNAVLPESQIPTAMVDSAAGRQPDSIPLGAVNAPALQMDDQPTPVRGTNPAPNERTVDIVEAPIDPIIDPSLIGIDPIIFQNAAGGIPPLSPIPAPPNPEIPIFPGMAPPISLFDNLLRARFATGFSISAVSQKPGGKVSEIGIFAVDDATGKIGGIAPGAPGYLQAIGNSARSIFSTLGGSFFNSAIKREIAIDANKLYGFFEVKDGSIADVKQQLLSGKTPTNILSSLSDANGIAPIKVTNNSTTGGYNVSINNDELVLNVVKLDSNIPNIPIGAKSQGLAEGRTIDLTGLTGTLKADITTKSSAAYNNNIGFYAVEDAIGTIQLANGKTVKPGDVNYAVEAIKSALTNSLQAGKTASKLGQDITGGKIYAPVVVAQGSLSDFLATNPTNIGGGINAYFNYVAANGDKKDHFRLIGNNTFGVEDQYGGGDRDFNDLVVNMNVKQA